MLLLLWPGPGGERHESLTAGGLAQAAQLASVSLLFQCNLISLFQMFVNIPLPGSEDNTKLIYVFLILEWLSSVYKQQWFAMLRAEQDNDIG